MTNEFEIEVVAPYSLNFLIFLQNVYLNQNRKGRDLLFPAITTKMGLRDSFEMKFKEQWNNVLQKLMEDCNDDLNVYDNKDFFYPKQMREDITQFKLFQQVRTYFSTWWGSFAGQFAIERALDGITETLYIDLQNWLTETGRIPAQRLQICLLYDKVRLTEPHISPYFAVIPIREFFTNYKNVVLQLQNESLK